MRADKEAIVHEVEEELEMQNKQRFTSVFNAIGGVSGLLALLTIAVFGGEMKRQITINTAAIHDLQTMGSVNLQTHIAADNKETGITADRISNISRLVEKLVEQNTALVNQVEKLIDMIKWQNNISKDPLPLIPPKQRQ